MSGGQRATPRRYDLDWLRVFAIFAVFVYHSSRFFDLEDWSVKNATLYSVVQEWGGFATQWMMPLIFLISGASVIFSIRKGGPGRFLSDKVLRLLVPLAVAVFTHASLQVYLERLSHGQFAGSYLEFLPHYFDGLYLPGGSGNFAFHGMHLWYLLVLFVFCLLLLPCFFWLGRGSGTQALRRVGDCLALPGAVVLLALPTVVLENTLDDGSFLGALSLGGWTLPHYLWFFFSGFLIFSHEPLQRRICQARWVGLALLLAALLSGGSLRQHPDLASWCWLVTMLGFGMKHLNVRRPFQAYASEAVLPFYILHQTVLLWLGYFVMQWPIIDLLKYLLVAGGSLVVIMVTYEFAVRRHNWLRFLFGMHPLPRQTQPAPAPALAVTRDSA